MSKGKSYSIVFEDEETVNYPTMGALHIALTAFGGILILVGFALNVVRFIFVKKIDKQRNDELLRYRDDAIMEPRMNVKVAEIGLRDQMHWKEYFTRDSKMFDYPPKENNQSSIR
ncbi:hypothetical protein L596_011532 [Steinernema carpocapsae]|uniref:Uncharacterized protein n=1 Tax=Steinernema carpocapsae TaxID=34508 RepID=A0A4V6XWE1_STECR|nr:hypothetical protein L596_011532 [Steinernema carpocapsae]